MPDYSTFKFFCTCGFGLAVINLAVLGGADRIVGPYFALSAMLALAGVTMCVVAETKLRAVLGLACIAYAATVLTVLASTQANTVLLVVQLGAMAVFAYGVAPRLARKGTG